MSSKISSAVGILRDEGPVSLARTTSRYLATRTGVRGKVRYYRSVKEVRNRMQTEEDLSDVLDTVLDIRPGHLPYQIALMQLRDEIEALTTRVEQTEPQTVLEIGTADGGSFYVWSRCLESADELVSVDLPGGRFGGGYDEQKTDIFRTFAPSKEMHFVRDDSHQTETFERVADLVDGEVDFLFIDGDHTYDGVKRDFEMYSQLVADGGLIALHDIATHPNTKAEVEARTTGVDGLEDRHLLWTDAHPDCNVDRFWEELVDEYETEEIISHPEQTWAGIGIVRV